MCHICEVVFGRSCPFCQGQRERISALSMSEPNGFNPLVAKSSETMDIIPDMVELLSEVSTRYQPERLISDTSVSQILPMEGLTVLERLLVSPTSVLGHHLSSVYKSDLTSFATRFAQIDWENKCGDDFSQPARCVNLFVRAMLLNLKSKLESDRLVRQPPGSKSANDLRLRLSQQKKLLKACYHAVFETRIDSQQTLGQFIFETYNQFVRENWRHEAFRGSHG